MYHIYPSGDEPIESVWKGIVTKPKVSQKISTSAYKKNQNKNNNNRLLLLLQPFSLKEFLCGQKKIRSCTWLWDYGQCVNKVLFVTQVNSTVYNESIATSCNLIKYFCWTAEEENPEQREYYNRTGFGKFVHATHSLARTFFNLITQLLWHIITSYESGFGQA